MQHPRVKNRTQSRIANIAALALAAAATPSALAHHAEWMSDSPALQGLSMPVHGLDHLLLSLTVGFLSAKLSGRKGLVIAGVHTAGLAFGALVNFAGSESPILTYGIPALAAIVSVLLMLRNTGAPLTLAICGLATLFAGLCNSGAMVAGVRDAGGVTSGLFIGSTLIGCGVVTALGACVGSSLNLDGKPRQSTVAAAILLALTAASVLSPDLNEAIIRFLEN